MIDFDEIRKEIAIEHNTLLRKDDPILMTTTLNDLMFRHYCEYLAQQGAEQNEAQRKAIEVALQKSVAEAKITASSLIIKAAGYVSEEVKTAISEAVVQAVKEIRGEVKNELAGSTNAIWTIKSNAFLYGCVATSIVMTLGIFVLPKVLI